MEKFARLFDFEDHQVLVTKEYDDEDLYKLSISTEIGGARFTTKLTFKEEETLNKAFDEYAEDAAKSVRKLAEELWKEEE